MSTVGRLLATLWLFTAVSVAYFVATLFIYVSHVVTNGASGADTAPLSPTLVFVNTLLLMLLLPATLVTYGSWEIGIRPLAVPPLSHAVLMRTGVIVKTALLTLALTAALAVLFSRSLPGITIDGIQITSTLPLFTTLLVPVTLLAPLTVLCGYLLLPQYYSLF